ncbi:hypothetical protein GUITHDRAFT_133209 [Guillardia theta CCMP2712]|uniref:Helicase-associated domain-containing protein n=1 Tax=Guillardia theta (strain CCMP2712) TaxID=905079 RepID=L1JZ73_GUITC|nr:hypothetical protein GUITHDRAFT_133209 [Guillardia theta CCMP2712]EKX53510.1 hypothetical protein GUITHDRAFT_133209 [Guillardia theta CCMP2712]|eukprot:XP_005840490.1 hypothetical protein GUITHDRAFT_133209 [Guillardia theta CCMP2712]
MNFLQTLGYRLSLPANDAAQCSLAPLTRELAGEHWEAMFNELVRYKQNHGHCVVHKSNDTKHLLKWIKVQKFRNKKLSKARRFTYGQAVDTDHAEIELQRLLDLGLIFNAKEASWVKFFDQYVDYIRTYSDTSPTFRFPQNPSLGVWVARQRQLYHRGMLQSRRWRKLQAIGFVWSVAYPLRKGPTSRAIVAPQLCSREAQAGLAKRWLLKR